MSTHNTGDSNEYPQHITFYGELMKIILQLLSNTCTHFICSNGVSGWGTVMWAISRENVSSEIFDQVWLKPVCSATATSWVLKFQI